MSDTCEINSQLYTMHSSGVPSNHDKQLLYEEAIQVLQNLLDNEDDTITRMATISNLLHTLFSFYFWTGFYRVAEQTPNMLIVGPYSGTLGCTKIPFNKGVCGAAASKQETLIVTDVHDFEGYISCDSKSQSEIVVPVLNAQQKLLAVFDVDSEYKAAFTNTDQIYLERIMRMFFA